MEETDEQQEPGNTTFYTQSLTNWTTEHNKHLEPGGKEEVEWRLKYLEL